MKLFFTIIFLSLLAISCSSASSKSSDSEQDISDSDEQTADETDDEYNADADTDSADIQDKDSIVEDLDTEESDTEDDTDSLLPDEDSGIPHSFDDSFLTPNHGFTMKLIGTIGDYAAGSVTPPDELAATLVSRDGVEYSIGVKAYSYAAFLIDADPSQDKIFTHIEGDFIETGIFYSAETVLRKTILQSMTINKAHTLPSGPFCSTVIYKNRNDGTTAVSCPKYINDNSKDYEFLVLTEERTWDPGENLSLMVNQTMIDDPEAIIESYGSVLVTEYYQTCICYDVINGTYSRRNCLEEDIKDL